MIDQTWTQAALVTVVSVMSDERNERNWSIYVILSLMRIILEQIYESENKG